MFRSVLSNRRFPLVAGLALGGAAALLYSRSMTTRLQAEAPGALDPNSFIPIPLRSAKYVSGNTKEFVFDLPEDHTLGGKVAFMVLFKHTTEEGKNIIRPYTPISTPDTQGSATFVIKTYPNGVMSKHLHGLQAGDHIQVKGPIQKYPIDTNQHRKIALLGGGTGITPLFQILQKIANDPEDKTDVNLYFANNTPQDVLIKDEIEELIAKKPEQLHVTYFAAKAGDDWKGERGFITKDYLKEHLYPPSEENLKIFICGPPPFYEALSGNKTSPSDQGELTGALKELGYNKDQVFKF